MRLIITEKYVNVDPHFCVVITLITGADKPATINI